MKILRGKKPHNQAPDTFRELLSSWEELGYCEVIDQDDDEFCWVGNIGRTLLYEYPRPDISGIPANFSLILSGNTPLSLPTYRPWIFWGRHPQQLFKMHKDPPLPYKERDIESIFLGKVENHIQLANRVKFDWSSCISFFNMPVHLGDSYASNYTFTQKEYLEFLSQSKFGLCLPGYGPKCNREIEYLALGVVPIFTPFTDISYHRPLIKDEHYFFAETPNDVAAIIRGCSEDQWHEMSQKGMEWFKKNCSPLGSFETTCEILKS